MLDKVAAQYLIVLIDCCYAEAVATGIGLPINLRDRKGQLIVASARANQQSWEDNTLQRSIFSDIVVRSLSVGSPIADLSGNVDVETRLVPYLREQVPLEAATRKRGQPQEPVSVGLMAQPLKLPTVAARSVGRPFTTVEAIRAGSRRVLLGVGITLVVGLLVIDALVFHVDVGPAGQLFVQPGLRFTFDLIPFHLSNSVDTGINISDFDVEKRESFIKFANDGIRGIQSHSDEHGLKTWFADVIPLINGTLKKTLSAFAFGELAAFHPDDEPPPIQEAFFLSEINNQAFIDVASTLYSYDRYVGIQCSESATLNMDFNILNVPSGVFSIDAFWLALTVSSEPSEYAKRVVEIVRLAAYRAAHQKDLDVKVSEFTTFASAIVELEKAVMPTNQMRLGTSVALKQSAKTWCGVYAAFARAVLGEAVDSQNAEDEFRQMLIPVDSEFGVLPSPSEVIAADALARIALIRPLSGPTLETLATIIDKDHDLDATTPANSLLDEISLLQPLSDRLRGKLFQIVRAPHEEFDFNYLVAIRILASNIRFLTEQEQNEISDWLKLHSEDNRTMSDVNEALGLASATRPLNPDEIHILEERLPLVSLFPLPKSTYRGDLVITADNDKAAVALGRVAQSVALPQDILKRLDNVAQYRETLIGREEILKGLAFNWYKSTTDLPGAITHRIRATEANKDRRKFETDIAAARLRGLTAEDRETAIKGISSRWREETEPEVRIALARVISAAISPYSGQARASIPAADCKCNSGGGVAPNSGAPAPAQ